MALPSVKPEHVEVGKRYTIISHDNRYGSHVYSSNFLIVRDKGTGWEGRHVNDIDKKQKVSGNWSGVGWHKELIPVTQPLTPRLENPEVAELLFEELIRARLARVSEWPGFVHAITTERNSCTFVDLMPHFKNGGSILTRFNNPGWSVEVPNGLKSRALNMYAKLNKNLKAIKDKYQQGFEWIVDDDRELWRYDKASGVYRLNIQWVEK